MPFHEHDCLDAPIWIRSRLNDVHCVSTALLIQATSNHVCPLNGKIYHRINNPICRVARDGCLVRHAFFLFNRRIFHLHTR